MNKTANILSPGKQNKKGQDYRFGGPWPPHLQRGSVVSFIVSCLQVLPKCSLLSIVNLSIFHLLWLSPGTGYQQIHFLEL